MTFCPMMIFQQPHTHQVPQEIPPWMCWMIGFTLEKVLEDILMMMWELVLKSPHHRMQCRPSDARHNEHRAGKLTLLIRVYVYICCHLVIYDFIGDSTAAINPIWFWSNTNIWVKKFRTISAGNWLDKDNIVKPTTCSAVRRFTFAVAWLSSSKWCDQLPWEGSC